MGRSINACPLLKGQFVFPHPNYMFLVGKDYKKDRKAIVSKLICVECFLTVSPSAPLCVLSMVCCGRFGGKGNHDNCNSFHSNTTISFRALGGKLQDY